MSEAEPGLVLEIRVAASRDVLDAFDRGQLDAAVALQHDSRRLDGETLLSASFGWMAAPDFEYHPPQPLRLATQAEPCSVRHMAIGALDEAGVAWTEVFVGGGVATIGAAVSAGWPSPRSGIAWRPSGRSTWARDTGCRPCRRATWCSTRT